MKTFSLMVFAIALTLGLSACMEEEIVDLPSPAQLTQEPVGYYCSMTVADHKGPKGQIWLKSKDQPIWFSSVRDTITFTLLAEEPKDIRAIYVTDMSTDESWESPKSYQWIDINTAHFVTGSFRAGGMGAPEPVPFASKESAKKFSLRHGGKVVAYSKIADGSTLGPAESVDHQPDAEHEG